MCVYVIMWSLCLCMCSYHFRRCVCVTFPAHKPHNLHSRLCKTDLGQTVVKPWSKHYQLWSNCGWAMSSHGQAVVKLWSKSGRSVVNRGRTTMSSCMCSGHGQIVVRPCHSLVRPWPSLGWVVIKSWSTMVGPCQAMVRPWSNCGQSTGERLSNTGQQARLHAHQGFH